MRRLAPSAFWWLYYFLPAYGRSRSKVLKGLLPELQRYTSTEKE